MGIFGAVKSVLNKPAVQRTAGMAAGGLQSLRPSMPAAKVNRPSMSQGRGLMGKKKKAASDFSMGDSDFG